jgi:class 3 adenylate cyclase/CHAT domain-containing protein/predicted negative regulator of RcsB-dependent stress response
MAMAAPDKSSPHVPDSGPQPLNLEELLRERIKLDVLLQQQFRRDVTLLFTDIKDSTAYFEQRGDLRGRQMLLQHNDLLSPIVMQHQGTVLKTIGDTIMAAFVEPATAVQSAIIMQRALRDHNQAQEVAEQIHIRIGINSGQGLVETHDVFGDVVNVASRIESCALPDQILISNTTYERLPGSIPCRFLGATEVKGKVAPIELYEVHWDERKTFQETVLLRGPGVMARPTKIFVLEVSRQGERLKLSAHERWPGEERAVKSYTYRDVSFMAMQQEVDTMLGLLNRITDRRGTLAPSVWQDIKARGAALYDQILTPDLQEKLRASTATDLFLSIDDALVQIPWELLFDGQSFLCRRFSMGRLVSTQQALVERQERTPEQALRMLIVADPQGDLEAASREGKTIQAELAGEAQRLRVDTRHRRVGISYVKEALSHYDVLHYAGHADYDLQEPSQSGWRLADGKLTARDVLHLGEAALIPSLVFCNACQSGQTQAWEISQEAEQGIYGLANALLLVGAQHYIGSFWELPDQPSATFAIAFYRALAHSIGVGKALRRARQALAERYGEDSVVWASYVLYGDPTCGYLEATETEPLIDEEPAELATVSRGEGRPLRSRRLRLLLGAGALLLLLLVLALLVTGRFQRTPSLAASPLAQAYEALEQKHVPEAETLFKQLGESPEKRLQGQAYAGLAAVAFSRGDYQQALDLAQQAERTEPEIAYSHVIRGHIFLNQGKIAEAAAAYRTATAKAVALPWQQAVAYDRLGRIYAAQGETAKALQQYDKAISQQQDMATVHANKGYLLEQLGKHQEALEHYRQALQIKPDDPLTTMLLHDAERHQQLAQDREQQQRIDRLVDELVQAYREDTDNAPVVDPWTSRPLTLAFLDFQRQGSLSARAGEAEFVMLSVTHALRASGRVSIVGREVLHRVLAELKLSASDIVDSQAGLRQGKILAARLLATGSFTHFGKAGLLSLRLIETETTLVNATAVQLVDMPGEISQAVQQVSASLLKEIRRAYPLRGRIERITAQGEVVLNLGARHGVKPGLVMQILDSTASGRADDQVVHTPVGRIEVTHVEAQVSQGRVLEHTGPVEPGHKVQEVLEP